MPRYCLPSSKQVSMGHRMPLIRTSVVSGVSGGALRAKSAVPRCVHGVARSTTPGSRPPLADPNHPQGGKRRHEWALLPALIVCCDQAWRQGGSERSHGVGFDGASPHLGAPRLAPRPDHAGPAVAGRSASPACRGALRRNTTSPAQPSGRAAWYHGQRLRHRPPSGSAGSQPGGRPGSSPRPAPVWS